MEKVKIGLYGTNGHQIHEELVDRPDAQITALAGFAPAEVPEKLRGGSGGVRVFDTLDQMLAQSDTQMISLCSPLRCDQAGDAVKCLEAGRHVYAEKPSATTQAGLDRILQTVRKTGKIYHEQAATAFEQPYATLRKIVASGAIGPVIQVFCQKSYPWGDWRLQDERVDGGLALQAGVYATRFVEHVAGVKIRSLILNETKLGNPVASGQCRRAVSMLMELANGGLASAVVNYCCPAPERWGRWGYETLRIFGAAGFVESIDHGRIGTLALTSKPRESVDFTAPEEDYLGMFLEEIRTGKKVIPFSLEEELSPTRWVVRGKQAAVPSE